MSIETSVRQAFAGTMPPSGAYFLTDNDEGASHVLLGRRWEEVQPEQLRLHSAAVFFLAPNAFAYFLPAFIIASLLDAGVRDSLLTRLLPPKADPARPSFIEWWRLLTIPQKQVVVEFVEHCIQTGEAWGSAEFDALKRLGGPNKSFERTREG